MSSVQGSDGPKQYYDIHESGNLDAMEKGKKVGSAASNLEKLAIFAEKHPEQNKKIVLVANQIYNQFNDRVKEFEKSKSKLDSLIKIFIRVKDFILGTDTIKEKTEAVEAKYKEVMKFVKQPPSEPPSPPQGLAGAGKILKGLAQNIGNQAEEATNAFNKAAQPLVDQGRNVVNQLGEALQPVVDKVQHAAQQAGNVLNSVAEDANKIINPKVQGLKQGILGRIDKPKKTTLANKAKKIFNGLVKDNVKEAVKQARKVMNNVRVKVGGDIENGRIKAWQCLQGLKPYGREDETINQLLKVVDQMPNMIRDLNGEKLTELKEKVINLKNDVKQKIENNPNYERKPDEVKGLFAGLDAMINGLSEVIAKEQINICNVFIAQANNAIGKKDPENKELLQNAPAFIKNAKKELEAVPEDMKKEAQEVLQKLNDLAMKLK